MRTCGKVAYTSEQKATGQARWIERKGKQMRAYRCPICYLWHLTSEVEKKRIVKKKNHKPPKNFDE